MTYGATLPISYTLSSLPGTVRYVATTGSDTASGSSSAPYATLTKAVSSSVSGDSIVIRGGTYRQGNVSVPSSKTLRIVAYPGEIPVFNGAQTAASWTADGSLRYTSYTPRPVTDGGGISFSTGQNLTGDGVGKYPDQAWIGSTQLRQVSARASVVDGTFWVDRTNGRLYLTAVDAAKSGIEVSNRNVFLGIQATGTTVEGLRVTRFSNGGGDYGVIRFDNPSTRVTLRNLEISESAFNAVTVTGSGGTFSDGSRLDHVTVTTSNWMGVALNYTDNVTLDGVKITNMNQFGEFAASPASGALKTSRTHYTTVKNSYIAGNNSKGLWFDQSNYRTVVANNEILDNTDSGVFFEISDNLLLINNYIRATGTAKGLKGAGSSGLRIVNNTFVGGSDPIRIYADNRSIPGCADPAEPICDNSYSSDRDTQRPRQATIDWMPRLDLMLNNIVAYPTSRGSCSAGRPPACITLENDAASVTIQSVIHKAEAARGIPQTVMNGNVYANGTGPVWGVNTTAYATPAEFSTAMAAAPVSITGLEAVGSKAGNSWVNADGSPTSALSAVHGQAIAVPTTADINLYIPAGTKHYGVTWK